MGEEEREGGMKQSFLEALIGNKEQRKNSRVLCYEMLLIIGAVFFGHGLILAMPQEWVGVKEIGFLGFVLILIALTSYKIENIKKKKSK